MAGKDDWRTVEPGTLSADTQALYEASKVAYRAYAAAKGAFESAMQEEYCEHLPHGHELKFGYMFGKLSIAVGPAKEKPKAKAQGTLADWLAGQAVGGHAA